MRLNWKIGVEIELLAPAGSTRADLARALAAAELGSVRRFLHQDSEPSRVPGRPIFYNLTPGFEALDGAGLALARCVDDLTLQHDLHRQAPPKAGWWRVVGDDERLLRLIALHINPELDLPDALSRLPGLFQGQLLPAAGGLYRLVDAAGAPLAIAAPLPGERERPCELITPPLEADHAAYLERLLSVARQLHFGIPLEGATHIHFDAEALCSAHVIANLVNVLMTFGPSLRRLCATPAHFRRVGALPAVLRDCVNQADFRALTWPQAQARLRATEPSKYCDYNFKNIAYGRADRHTFEVRIFPAHLHAQPICAAAALFEGILRHCIRSKPIHPQDAPQWNPEEASSLLDTLALDADADQYWRQRLAEA